jgi:hypothetical protein
MWLSAIKLAMSTGSHIYKKKKETQMMMANAQSDWKDEFVLIILTLPIAILAYSVWSSDPDIMVKVDMFFDKFANLPSWFTNLWILVVASIYGIKGTQIFKGGVTKK